MKTEDGLVIAAALAPFVTRFMQEAEKSALPGADKKAAVMELTGTVYEGARRLGALDGIKEIRGVEWAVLAPFIGIVVDGIAKLFNALGLWLRKKATS